MNTSEFNTQNPVPPIPSPKRRVGTATLGISLILFGSLFIVHLFYKGLTYLTIMKLWPVVLIIAGLEVLISCFTRKEERFSYDGGSIAILILLTFFAVGMAVMEAVFAHGDIIL